MENRTLISMVDATASKIEKVKSGEMSLHEFFDSQDREVILRRQSLELWQFVPVGENGEVLEEPEMYTQYKPELGGNMNQDWQSRCQAYTKAKSRCIFEGFEVDDEYIYIPNTTGEWIFYNSKREGWLLDKKNIQTIEDLVPYNLTLTENALL